MEEKVRIAVLLGGLSSERDVSLRSGRAVLAALQRKGYEAYAIDVGENVAEQLTKDRPDIAFNVLHGKFGEDGTIQGLLELLRIPYTGSGVLASAMAMDKVVSKRVFEREGIPVAAHSVVSFADFDRVVASSCSFVYPLIVKPRAEGSSVGVSLVKEPGHLATALEAALFYDNDVLMEQYIRGREVQIGVLERDVLGAIEVRPSNEFYDYEAKYTTGKTQYIPAPDLPSGAYETMASYSLRALDALGCEGGVRIDFILSDEGKPFILEVNTLPGMTELSLLPKIAAQAGIGFDDLVERILLGARLKL